MEILTPSSERIKKNHNKKLVYVSFRKSKKDFVGLHFTTALMKEFVLKPGMLFTFVIDTGRLYFHLSPKEGEGFLMTPGKHESGEISSRLLLRTIIERLPSVKTNGNRFPARVSMTRISDCASFEILIDKRL